MGARTKTSDAYSRLYPNAGWLFALGLSTSTVVVVSRADTQDLLEILKLVLSAQSATTTFLVAVSASLAAALLVTVFALVAQAKTHRHEAARLADERDRLLNALLDTRRTQDGD